MTSGSKRSNGEGTLFWREDRQRWVVQFTFDSFSTKQRRTTRSFKSEKEAERYLNKLRHDHERGLAAADDRIRFGDFLDHWIADVVDPSQRALATKSSYRENVRLHVKPGMGRTKVIDLRPEHVRRFLHDKRDSGYSQSMLDTLSTILRLALDHAMFEEKVHRNVARIVPVPQAIKATKEVTAWTQEEAQRFLDKNKDESLFPLFLLVMMVGLRKGEVLALQWACVDLDNRILRVVRQVQRIKGVQGLVVSEPKGKRKRTIVLPGRCVDVLKTHRERQDEHRSKLGGAWSENDLVFPSPVGTFIDPRNFNRIMTAACRRAKLQQVGPHAMRHTAATIARSLGVDWREIQEMLGHSSDQVTKLIYVDMIPDLHRDAADRINKAYE
jgi:integrase